MKKYIFHGIDFKIITTLSGGNFMKMTKFGITLVIFTSILTLVLLSSCNKMSETVYDETASMNGSFEIIESGLPVNWLIYSPKTIPTGDYELILDIAEFKDGHQSLKFLVRECSNTGGWHSPGITNEYKANPGSTYKVSFWIKNDGCEYVIKIGGVSAFEGDYKTIVKSKEKIDTWKQFEFQYKMPLEDKFDRIRFELNILNPGSFWIDDVNISGIDGESVVPTAK